MEQIALSTFIYEREYGECGFKSHTFLQIKGEWANMRQTYMNRCCVSGFLSSTVSEMACKEEMRKYKPYLHGAKFFIKIPRTARDEISCVPIRVAIWGDGADVVLDKLKYCDGQKITIVGRLETGFNCMSGKQYYMFRLEDFCLGWYNLYKNETLGEIYKANTSNFVVGKLSEEFKNGEI